MVNKISYSPFRSTRVIIIKALGGLNTALFRPKYKFIPINRIEVAIIYNIIGKMLTIRLVIINIVLAFSP